MMLVIRLSLIALLVTLGSPASAVDGVLEINQACAVNTGCFSGDTLGFPVTIDGSAGRSVRLTSDLSVAAVDTPAIEVTTDGVGIDLNNFEITGPVTCTGLGSAVSCMPASAGNGINALDRARVAVRDGRIRGFARGLLAGERAQIRNVVAESNLNDGIRVLAVSLVVESTAHQNGLNGFDLAGGASVIKNNVASANGQLGFRTLGSASSFLGNVAFDNGGTGIQASSGSVVRDNSAYLNQEFGIFTGAGSLVSDNACFDNDGDGIGASGLGSSVQRNTVYSNGGFGLNLRSDTAYRENAINGNTGGTVNNGVDAGANVCNGNTTCP